MRTRLLTRTNFGWAALLALLIGIAGMGWAGYRHFLRLPVVFQSARDRANWTAFGGAWLFEDDRIENDSDERGAKLIAGSEYWRDYTFSADVELESSGGDVGLMVRVQEPDEGVDAFRGVYAGLRQTDNSLVAGQADYGWSELPPQPVRVLIESFVWYHLQVAVRGCHLHVVASLADGSKIGEIDTDLPQCSSRGRVGLRSYRAGSAWKNIRVDPLNRGSAPL